MVESADDLVGRTVWTVGRLGNGERPLPASPGAARAAAAAGQPRLRPARRARGVVLGDGGPPVEVGALPATGCTRAASGPRWPTPSPKARPTCGATWKSGCSRTAPWG